MDTDLVHASGVRPAQDDRRLSVVRQAFELGAAFLAFW